MKIKSEIQDQNWATLPFTRLFESVDIRIQLRFYQIYTYVVLINNLNKWPRVPFHTKLHFLKTTHPYQPDCFYHRFSTFQKREWKSLEIFLFSAKIQSMENFSIM